MTVSLHCAIAIPACNEAVLLPRCLAALAAQTIPPDRFAVVVLANNCVDATVEQAQKFSGLLNLQIIEVTFENRLAHAGSARRAATDAAAVHSDIILTTDADCVADRNWVEAMIDAFSSDIAAVAGAVSGDWNELRHQPPAALAIGKLEWEYLALLATAEAIFDPQPHDPMPRHAQCCGANLGVRRGVLDAVGGIAAIPSGEDRALIQAIKQTGGKVRYDPRAHVMASARTAGRAANGMADALALRTSPNYLCDEQFEPADRLIARLRRQSLMRKTDHHDMAVAGNFKTKDRLTPAQLANEIVKLRAIVNDHHGN